MQYNTCTTCKACDGRAGILFSTEDHSEYECLNCHYTRKTGDICIHAYLHRTPEELDRTLAILNNLVKETE